MMGWWCAFPGLESGFCVWVLCSFALGVLCWLKWVAWVCSLGWLVIVVC